MVYNGFMPLFGLALFALVQREGILFCRFNTGCLAPCYVLGLCGKLPSCTLWNEIHLVDLAGHLAAEVHLLCSFPKNDYQVGGGFRSLLPLWASIRSVSCLAVL